jgi:Cys-tRNA(Pro)/Cys-tRNA(Cys) deacylase
METKTNVMRLLEQKKIPYIPHFYDGTLALSGVEVAQALGQNPAQAFKTLVTVGKSKQHYVFMIPVAEELDLKKAASLAHEKAVEMIKMKELLPLTGYIHGGCSPIGMKKAFRTFIHQTARDFPTIFFSAGRIGCQVETSLENLNKAFPIEIGDLV